MSDDEDDIKPVGVHNDATKLSDDDKDEEGKNIEIDNTKAMLSPSAGNKYYQILINLFLERRGFIGRTFNKMDPGSLRGSIFALTASAIGSGNKQIHRICVFNLD
jgi:hypothetical protein